MESITSLAVARKTVADWQGAVTGANVGHALHMSAVVDYVAGVVEKSKDSKSPKTAQDVAASLGFTDVSAFSRWGTATRIARAWAEKTKREQSADVTAAVYASRLKADTLKTLVTSLTGSDAAFADAIRSESTAARKKSAGKGRGPKSTPDTPAHTPEEIQAANTPVPSLADVTRQTAELWFERVKSGKSLSNDERGALAKMIAAIEAATALKSGKPAPVAA